MQKNERIHSTWINCYKSKVLTCAVQALIYPSLFTNVADAVRNEFELNVCRHMYVCMSQTISKKNNMNTHNKVVIRDLAEWSDDSNRRDRPWRPLDTYFSHLEAAFGKWKSHMSHTYIITDFRDLELFILHILVASVFKLVSFSVFCN